MQANVKCYILRKARTYTINGRMLWVKKDLGIQAHKSLKVTSQIINVFNKTSV